MKNIFIVLLILFTLFLSKNLVFASENSGPIISFDKIDKLPKDKLVTVPVYLNTNGKELDSLQLEINVVGKVKDLDAKIGSVIPVQEIKKEITDNNIFVSLTSLDPEKKWSTNENIEILNITFIHQGDGEITFSFNAEETVATTSDSENNELATGEDLLVKIGDILPTEKELTEEILPIEESDSLTSVIEEKQQEEAIAPNNKLLIGIIAFSLLAVVLILTYILKSSSKVKTDQELQKSENSPSEFS